MPRGAGSDFGTVAVGLCQIIDRLLQKGKLMDRPFLSHLMQDLRDFPNRAGADGSQTGSPLDQINPLAAYGDLAAAIAHLVLIRQLEQYVPVTGTDRLI